MWVDGWESLTTKTNQSRLENTVSALILLLAVVWWVGLEALWSGLVCASEFSLPGKTGDSHF